MRVRHGSPFRDPFRAIACAAAVLAAAAWVPPAAAGTFGLELTAAESAFRGDGGAAWGFWQPGKYDAWRVDSDDGLDLVEARAIFGGDGYSVFFAAGRYPTLDGIGSGPDDDVRLDLETWDLVVAQSFEIARGWLLTPWVGPTRVVIEERRQPSGDPDAVADTAESRLWGAAIGADLAVRVAHRFALTGRASFRWAYGDRDAHVSVPSGDDPQGGRVAVTDSVDRVMYGAEIGLQFVAARWLHVEGGWRTRVWEEKDGPGTFDGAYIRLILGL